MEGIQLNQPTHIINATIAVDFTQVFAPERVEGIKFMLGVETDEDVVNIIANEIISELEGAVRKRENYVAIVGANISPYEQSATQHTQESLRDTTEAEGITATEWTASPEDMQTEEFSLDADETDEEEQTLVYDEYSGRLIQSISDDIFNIESHLGEPVRIYLREYDSYVETVKNEFGDITSYLPITDMGEQAEELKSEDYVIEYKDIQGEVKYGKRDLNKKLKTEGESE